MKSDFDFGSLKDFFPKTMLIFVIKFTENSLRNISLNKKHLKKMREHYPFTFSKKTYIFMPQIYDFGSFLLMF